MCLLLTSAGAPEPQQTRREPQQEGEDPSHVAPPLADVLSMFPVPRLRAEELPPHIVHHPSDVVVKPGSPARLSCRAEGGPQVSFHWLRNGQPLQGSRADGQMQPIVLPEGSLFFLSVGEGPTGPSHQGVYTCVARNAAGTAVSRNASLHIAGMMRSTEVTLVHHSPPPGWGGGTCCGVSWLSECCCLV